MILIECTSVRIPLDDLHCGIRSVELDDLDIEPIDVD